MKIKKIILIVLCGLILVATPQKKAVAFWGETTANFAIQRIYEEVKEALLDALLDAAVDTITDTVNNVISGTSQATSLFITDWEDYLFNSPNNELGVYMNDFFTITSRGRSSGSNYQSNCGSSYSEWREVGAKNAVNVEIDLSNLQSDFEDYACSAQEMFAEGTWDAFDAFLDPKNNPLSFELIAEGVKENRKQQLEKKAEVEAIAYQGFKATFSDDGQIVLTPGSTTKDVQSNTLNVSNQRLANADSVGDVVVASVSKILTSVVKQGIGNARKNAQAQINEGICEASQDLRDELKNFTPGGSLFDGFGMGSTGQSSSGSCNIQ